MEGYSRKDEVCPPQLLDLIPKQREWLVKREEEKEKRNHGFSEEKELELRLGPPGEERDKPLLSLGYFSNNSFNGSQNLRFSSSENRSIRQTKTPFFQLQSNPHNLSSSMAKESSQNAEKKGFLSASANTAVANISQKRSAPTPVVGWPPIRSFRKNLASNGCSKSNPESQKEIPNKVDTKKLVENSGNGLFVKINMDGVPIGRKVDLKAYDTYEKLSSAVDELFRDLLAAQIDSAAGGIHNKQGEDKTITGLLNGNREYTLVYEDNEGDRMLVGDVPWHMFVSTVKRLRVLKSSELPTLCLGNKQEKAPIDAELQ